jgi:stearoyl-CoA desaturase (delta-9 desaturase)
VVDQLDLSSLRERPFRTRDRSTNVGWLALVSRTTTPTAPFPTSARHGLERGQFGTSAALIGFFERISWATHACWPIAVHLDGRRV